MSPGGAMPAGWAGGWLSIDLGAIADNWRRLAGIVRPAECAAVVQADAYGLGVARAALSSMAAMRPLAIALPRMKP